VLTFFYTLRCCIGENYQLFGQEEALGLRMKIDGATVMIPTIYNPSELRSDVTGKVVRFLQPDRGFVEKGQPYVEVEAMKMIMALKATESGEIRHNLSPGSIIGAGDLIASLTLKDPSKVKQISTFTERLQSVPIKDKLTTEEAAEHIALALDGYVHKTEDAVKTYFASAELKDIETFLATQFSKFTRSEQALAGQEDDAVVGAAVKAHKDNLSAAVPTLLAHKQSKIRAGVVLSLLSQLEFLPKRFPTYSLTAHSMAPALLEALKDLAHLQGPHHGPVKLKTQHLIGNASMPPFQVRLDSLKAQLMDPKTDFKALSKEPDFAVSVDLLVVLMSDESEAVRKAAMEVYIRRVYRAHIITSLQIDEVPDDGGRVKGGKVLSAKWAFTLKQANPVTRYGYMSMLPDFINMQTRVGNIVRKAASHLKKTSSFAEPINVLHIGFTHYDNNATPEQLATILQSTLKPYKRELAGMDVRMVNYMLVGEPNVNKQKLVSYFNHYAETGFQEDPTSRGMRPTMPQLLELNRLTKNYDLTRMPSVGRNAFLFVGKEKAVGGSAASSSAPQVLYLRSTSFSEHSATGAGAERIVVMAMDELERALLDPAVSETASSRLFVNFIADIEVDLETMLDRFQSIMDNIVGKYATRLLKLRVDEIEVKMRVRDKQAKKGSAEEFIPVRLIASSSTGGWLTREAYREYPDPVTGQTEKYCSLGEGGSGGEGSGVCVLDPYPTANVLQKKRATARRVGSTYATDFLGLIEVALINSWQSYFEKNGQVDSAPPSKLFTFEELVLPAGGSELVKEKRYPGSNKIGMLAWLTTLKTPQYPEGRQVVFIANDVTVQSGSFGVQEDEFFYKASEYARVRGLPRVFISCNSGARIGLVDDLKPKFKVAWKDESNPALGFDYLYLTEEDYRGLAPGTVDATPVRAANGETRYQLDAIIGQTHGIGVENLRGSGLIAGETSRAYDETFTLSYVTGRSVGIGAYLNRLGQRVIQMKQGPMILTGFSALNKLLGKWAYFWSGNG
jgi:acetyl-CoA carboxylase/biotin carboxylase 1